MRIDAMSEISQLYQAKSTKRKQGASAAASKDTVEISGFGRELQIAKQAVAQSADIREDRVKEIKASMANGTYNVPMGALADKLLNGFSL